MLTEMIQRRSILSAFLQRWKETWGFGTLWKNCCMFKWRAPRKKRSWHPATLRKTAGLLCVVMETIHSSATFSSALINFSDPVKWRNLTRRWWTEKKVVRGNDSGVGSQLHVTLLHSTNQDLLVLVVSFQMTPPPPLLLKGKWFILVCSSLPCQFPWQPSFTFAFCRTRSNTHSIVLQLLFCSLDPWMLPPKFLCSSPFPNSAI